MRIFMSFKELFNFRSCCPICLKALTYKVSVDVYDDALLTPNNLKDALSSAFSSGVDLSSRKLKTFSKTFSAEDSEITFDQIGVSIDLIKSKLTGNENAHWFYFDLATHCPHDGIGNAYEMQGAFEFMEENSPSLANEFAFATNFIRVNWELMKICSANLDAPTPNGSMIKILNNYTSETTAFSIAEMNLDGTNGTFFEKQIPLLSDDYFKYENSTRLYSRISSLMVMAER